MVKTLVVIGILSVIFIVLRLIFLIGLNIYEIVENKINKKRDCYSLTTYNKIWFCEKDNFYLIPTIGINKAYYFEISISWLCFGIYIGYRIEKDE